MLNFLNLVLFALTFSVIYPLNFWIPFNPAYKERFRKFNLSLPNVIGGVVLVSIWLMNIPLPLKMTVTFWKAALVSVSRYSWRKEYPNPWLMTIPCLIGIYAFIQLYDYLAAPGGSIVITELFRR